MLCSSRDMVTAPPWGRAVFHAFRACSRSVKSTIPWYSAQVSGFSSRARWSCPWTRELSITVTMPTIEELMVMGTAIISRFFRMAGASSGWSSDRFPSRPRVMRKFISI